MARIGIDARMIKATGIGRYISNLIEDISDLDNKNKYYIFLKKEEFDQYSVPSLNFTKVLADFHWYGISEQLKFPKLIESKKIDLMHFPHFNVPLFYRRKFVVNIHDLTLHHYKTIRASTKSLLTYYIKDFFYKFIIKSSIKRALKIFVISNFTKEDVINTFKISEDKILVTYPGGPSTDLLNKEPDNRILLKLKIKKPYILYVGNAYPHKNLENLVRALKYSPKNLSLVLAGKVDEFYERIKGAVSEEGLEDRVRFSGFVTDEELVALYKEADIYVFPSFNEGFGLPPLEAMAFGLPVASSNTSCLPEVLEEGVVYFDPRDPKDIADKVQKILGDDNLKSDLIKKGYNQIKKYSWQKMAQETLAIYEEFLKDEKK